MTIPVLSCSNRRIATPAESLAQRTEVAVASGRTCCQSFSTAVNSQVNVLIHHGYSLKTGSLLKNAAR